MDSAFAQDKAVKASVKMSDGTLQRTYADGKKEDVVWKSGEVKQIPPGPAYTTKNVGKTTLHLYVVQMK